MERRGQTIGEHAVVIGAGMGGLLAAAALAERFARVTVVERDALEDEPRARRAVPQGRHAHALLPRGQECLEELLPGIGAELIGAGAVPYRPLTQMRFSLGGHQLARGDTGFESIVASRPLIETVVRRRVARLPQVELVARCDAAGLLTDGDRVAGVRLLRRAPGSAEERVRADLVVAATGRGGRVPAWLEALGCPAPAEERLEVDFSYVSVHLALEPGALGDDRLVLIGARPGVPRTLALFLQEGGTWLLTLGGFHGHHPPREREAMLAFAATVAPRDVVAAIAAGTPLDEPVAFRFPASKRRRFRDLPPRLFPLGDAVCSFNPIYGQGMTVAALQAVALRDALGPGLEGAERRFFSQADRAIDQAWELAAGADLAQPSVPGRRSPRVRAVNRYLGRLFAAAEHDPELAVAFLRVSGMVDPAPALLRPRTVRRALRTRRSPVPAPERVLRVGDVETPLLEAGPPDSREAVVFVHGNPGSSEDWRALLASIGARGVRAVAWDAPGFGRSSVRGAFAQSVDAHAAFLGAALDALGVERAHVVAHDFGGPWALRWAAARPDRFASAVLLCTGALPGYRWHALARLWRAPVAGELFMATTTRTGFRALLRRGQQRPLPRPFLDRMFDDFDRATRRAVLDLYRSVPDVGAAGDELAAALAPLNRPALVLWGRDDPYLGVEHAERQRAAFPQADVRVLDDAGHWPHVDQPAAVADAVGEFLARHAGDAPALRLVSEPSSPRRPRERAL